MVLAAGPLQAQDAAGQLGILDLTANDGLNPATGNPWEIGDTYHLIFVTDATTEATETDITFYNDFVQAEAEKQGWGDADWFVMGSTALTNAVDNAVITGPVINISDQSVLALDAFDLWDLDFSASPSRPRTLAGENRNLHFGTISGGITHQGNALGAEDGNLRIAWTGWVDWAAAWRAEPNTDQKPLAAISQELAIVGAESSLALNLAVRGTSYDFSWESQEGKVYDLVSSTDLTTSPELWEVYDDGTDSYEAIPAAPDGLNTLSTIPSADAQRFFVIVERDEPSGG